MSARIINFDWSNADGVVRGDVITPGAGENFGFFIQADADAEDAIAAVQDQLAAAGVDPLTDDQLKPVRAAVARLHTVEVRAALTASRAARMAFSAAEARRDFYGADVPEYAALEAAAKKARAALHAAVVKARDTSPQTDHEARKSHNAAALRAAEKRALRERAEANG